MINNTKKDHKMKGKFIPIIYSIKFVNNDLCNFFFCFFPLCVHERSTTTWLCILTFDIVCLFNCGFSSSSFFFVLQIQYSHIFICEEDIIRIKGWNEIFFIWMKWVSYLMWFSYGSMKWKKMKFFETFEWHNTIHFNRLCGQFIC